MQFVPLEQKLALQGVWKIVEILCQIKIPFLSHLRLKHPMKASFLSENIANLIWLESKENCVDEKKALLLGERGIFRSK